MGHVHPVQKNRQVSIEILVFRRSRLMFFFFFAPAASGIQFHFSGDKQMLLIKNIEFGCLDFNHHNYFNEKKNMDIL